MDYSGTILDPQNPFGTQPPDDSQPTTPAAPAAPAAPTGGTGGNQLTTPASPPPSPAAPQPTLQFAPTTYAAKFNGLGELNQWTSGLVSADKFLQRIRFVEGGGPGVRSPAGAMGTMQVMPGTAMNPGYGITPAKDFSDAELTRVGTEYGTKMYEKYGPILGMVAYNAGPGTVDRLIKQYGDPRKTGDWLGFLEHAPAESKAYVLSGISGVRHKPGSWASSGDGGGGDPPDYKLKPATPPEAKPGDNELTKPQGPQPIDQKKAMQLAMLQELMKKGFGVRPIAYDPFKVMERGLGSTAQPDLGRYGVPMLQTEAFPVSQTGPKRQLGRVGQKGPPE